jgi:glycosyltransferase involved in cell wall biosynthesis
MRRIRVARIITRLNVGGPAIQAMLLTQRLDPERFETILVCGRTGPSEGDMLELRPESGLAPIVIPGLGRKVSPLADARAFVGMVSVLRRFRPHVVHTHMSKAGFLGRVAARVVGVPVVVHTFHGNVLRGYFGGATSGLFLLVERALARLSTRIVSISQRQTEELRRLGIGRDGQIVEIPLGLDLRHFLDPPRGHLRAELGVSAQTPLVGIVTRLVPIKGVDTFLAAARRIADTTPDARFVIIGDGEDREHLQRLAGELGISERVRFTGWRADLPAVYADLDVVVLSSRNEGTPVSLIEALAASRAVVATAVGGVPDLIGNSERGVLVPPDDPGALGGAIVDLIRDPSRGKELARRGRDHVYQAHDAATLVARIEALYTELCSES